MLSTAGYDGLQLREVARQARVSLSTIYKHFSSRDELVIAAMERWMTTNLSGPLPTQRPDESLADILVRAFRQIFEPWKQNPTMLTVFLRATLLPGSDRMWRQAADTIPAQAARYFDGYDAEFREDVTTILSHLTHGLLGWFASGELDIAEIDRVYERAVRRLTPEAQS